MSLWEGEFGNEYTKRNAVLPDRKRFWAKRMRELKPETVLEVGANRGFNTYWIHKAKPTTEIWATDINRSALRLLRQEQPEVNTVFADVMNLPFKGYCFDLVISVGLLIHIPPDKVRYAIAEMARVARRHLLIAEYHNQTWEMIPYHGKKDVLWKGPYDEVIWQELERRLINTGFLTQADGFDRVTWWLYER